MYEQDVKLARMLVDKIRSIRSDEDSVGRELEQAREELSRVQKIREERQEYLSILSEAADLLDSKDLVVESPDTSEQQELVDNLEFKLEELDEESRKYNKLLDALREKAPQLFEDIDVAAPEASPQLSEEALEVESEQASAEEPAIEEEHELAAGEDEGSEEPAGEGAQSMEAAAEADWSHEDEVAEADEEHGSEEEADSELVTLEMHVGSNGHGGELDSQNGNGSHESAAAMDGGSAAPADSQPAPGPAEEIEQGVVKVAVESPERTLSRFNLDHLKKKEAFTFGRGAAYIVDGDSVLDRLPYYDYSLRGVLEAQTRDELARDIDVLSTELHGKFHIVYSSQYRSSIQLGEYVELNCADGDGGKEAGDEHIRGLVSELVANHTCVCVITGDVALADSVRGQSIHILQLHDFFRA